MKISIIKSSILTIFTLVVLSACTKLDPVVYSRLGVAELYSDTNVVNNAQNLVNVVLVNLGNAEHTRLGNSASGENCDFVLRQGVNGEYREAYRHKFNYLHQPYNQAWNTFYAGVASANLIISEISSLPNRPKNFNKIIAELKVSRAFYLYMAMDNFGNIPLDTLLKSPKGSVKTNTRLEAFKYIEKELKQNLPLLDNNTSSKDRVNKGVAATILAQLYLNAHVYTGEYRWADCIAACDMVNGYGYELAPNYFDNFLQSPSVLENILVGVRVKAPDVSSNTFIVENLQESYAALAVGVTGSAWNGFSSTAENYTVYSNTDKRKLQWLEGTQRASLPGTRAIDAKNTSGVFLRNLDGTVLRYGLNNIKRWGLPTDAEIAVKDSANKIRSAGVRNIKYYPNEGEALTNNLGPDNDYVILRYADVLMMKAECLFRLGNAAEAATLINRVRQRAFAVAEPFNAATLTLEDIRDERTREFMLEGYARRDNIRFEDAGSTIKYWSRAKPPLKMDADVDPIASRIYPIPALQLQLNPNLRQNPTY